MYVPIWLELGSEHLWNKETEKIQGTLKFGAQKTEGAQKILEAQEARKEREKRRRTGSVGALGARARKERTF